MSEVIPAEEGVMVLLGDALTVLKTLPAESVHCCVTSPPYFGLRDNQTARWEGGDPACDHRGVPNRTQAGFHERYHGRAYASDKQGELCQPFPGDCPRCGAVRVDQQLGMEGTPEAYIERLVEVFREVRRVLRKEGTLWLVLGDSYASRWPCQRRNVMGTGSLANGKREARPERMGFGLKDKDLMLIPHRAAMALQADGWYVRMDVVWNKPNAMPQSVRDRPTSSHEYIFLLTRSAQYFYDSTAIREPHSAVSQARVGRQRSNSHKWVDGGPGHQTIANDLTQALHPGGRNKRSVWTIATRSFSGAHFSTYPPALVEPCIKAGTSEHGVCPHCGAPWTRLTERTTMVIRKTERAALARTHTSGTMLAPASETTIGWAPSCVHEGPPIPATVLDPFLGSGTTAAVALSLGRHAIGIELQASYLPLVRERLAKVQLKSGL